MSADLEREAREAAEAYRVSCGLDAVGEGQLTHEVIGYSQGFFDAATLREKELSQLRAKLESVPAAVKIERASRYEPCEECEFLLYRWKPAMHNCNKSLVIDAKGAEIATLRARVAELEGMVPKWVEIGSEAAGLMEDCGWRFHKVGAAGMMLMVPPIQVPETKP